MKKILAFLSIAFACVLGFRTSAFSATLPAGYTELEYIESTGTQWIDTGIRPDSNFAYELKFSGYTIPTTGGGEHVMFGETSGGWEKMVGINQSKVSNRSNVIPYIKYDGVQCSLAQQTEGTFLLNPTGLYFNGNLVYSKTPDSFETEQYSIYLFAINFKGTASSMATSTVTNKFTSYKLEFFKVWDNNTMVRNMVPAQNSEGVVGLYDTVNNRFYTNDGTGEFVAGPAVGIKIATTNYVTQEFAPVQTLLTQTNTTITNTITQSNTNTASIATLAAQKQNTPATNCPTGKKCLLVKDINGNDNWYPIVDAVSLYSLIGNATGTNSFNSSTFNSADDTFSRDYGALGTIYGQGRCSTIPYNSSDLYTNPTRLSTLTEETGVHCYCKLNAYKPRGGDVQNINMKWMYSYTYGSASVCSGPNACDTACGRLFEQFSGYGPALLDGIKVAQ